MRKQDKVLEADALDLDVLEADALDPDPRGRWEQVHSMLRRPTVRYLGALVVLGGTGVSAWALWDIILGT